MNLAQQITEIVREFPGITVLEIGEFFPNTPRSSISGRTSTMVAQGILRREWDQVWKGNTVNKQGRFFIGDGTPVALPRKVKSKPSEVSSNLLVERLESEIAELKLWRENAIARFPDLAVDPLLLRARELVAKASRDGGDNAAAEAIIAGRRDDSVAVRATLAALELAA